jgi:transposase
MMRCLDGNASDSKVFQKRCRELIDAFKQSEGPRYLVGDSKLYHASNRENLAGIKFIKRIPKNYQEEKKVLEVSMVSNQWVALDEQNKYYVHQLNHLGIDQRWLVVYSSAARTRAEATLNRTIEKEGQAIDRTLLHLSNQEFNCETDARKVFTELNSKLDYHELLLETIVKLERYAGVGRPKQGTSLSKVVYQVKASYGCLLKAREESLLAGSTYVIGTNTVEAELSPATVIEAYKNQNASIERGFRFLKDPQFFVSSFYVKKPSRIMSLLMIMTLCLLIHSVMQRHLRQVLLDKQEKVPNQINQQVSNPAMRWIFQLMEGIDVVYIQIDGQIERQILGITQLRQKIISLFYPSISAIYLTNQKL